VDVCSDRSLHGAAGSFFAGGRDAALAQDDLAFGNVAIRFRERLLALHHSRSGSLPELLY